MGVIEREGIDAEVKIGNYDSLTEARRGGCITISWVLLTERFSEDERKTVGLHELGHLKYGHLDKRDKLLNLLVVATFCLILGALATFLLGVFLFGLSLIVYVLSLGMGIFGWVILLRYLNGVYAQQEFEADGFAADRVSSEALISFLRKAGETICYKTRRPLARLLLDYTPVAPPIGERIERLKRR